METKTLDQNNGGMEKVYDVFISYRRLDTKTARNLEQALELRGLKVYFDQEELDDGKFNEELYKAIDQSKNAIFLMTKGALDRCAKEGDWVRNELERILEKGINLVLVHPSDVEPKFPEGLPKSLCGMRYIEVSELHLGKLFSASVDKIVKRLKGIDMAQKKTRGDLPVLGKPVDEVSLTGLKGQDAKHYKKALGYYNVVRYRSALAEFERIEEQANPFVRYYVLLIKYLLDGDVMDGDFEEACCAARDLGCTDAMRLFVNRHMPSDKKPFDPVSPSECIEWLKKAIVGGNSDALADLGSAYENGKGAVRDPATARELYRMSYEAGSFVGKIAYGQDCLLGNAGEKNLAVAEEVLRPVIAHLRKYEDELTNEEYGILMIWYSFINGGVVKEDPALVEKFATLIIESKGRSISGDLSEKGWAYFWLGFLFARNADGRAFESLQKAYDLIGGTEGTVESCLAKCFDEGIGVDKDEGKAIEYYERAAELGNSAARCTRALQLVESDDEQDFERGKMLLRLAAEGGDPDAEWVYGAWLIGGVHFEKNVPEGMRWLEKAVRDNNAGAMNTLGQQYRDGNEVVSVDYVKAFKLFEQGALGGLADAMNSLGFAYLNGQGVARDVTVAEKWFLRAAKSGDADAECSLGTRFYNGEFGDRDVGEAIKWWERAAEQGDVVAMSNLGMVYRDGDGVNKNIEKALEWYERAANAGNADAACTLGANYHNGVFGEPDKKKSLEWFQQAAKLGETTAMNKLGIMYRDGDGVDVDLHRAVDWFRRAAEGGLPDAMTNLGFAYLNGAGVLKDVKEAEAWFVKAAETEDADAEVSLGTRYAQGAFGKLDYPKAVEWWLKAARQGQIVAMWNLGDVYQRGADGVEKNLAQSFDWFKESAEAGLPDAMESLGLAYLGGLGTIADEEKAKEWLTRAAELDDVSAICSMGTRFFNGEFGERDVGEAIKWWERAAEHGDVVAMANLGMVYRDGDGVDKDIEKALEWYERAANAGNADAACTLGANYYNGVFGEPDKKKALQWSLKAAKLDDATAMNNLGIMYQDGDGVEADPYHAVAWFRRAADGGLPGAMINLGFAYLNGTGVPKDVKEAETWFVKAAETGDADAEVSLGTRYAQGAFGKVDYVKAKEWWEKAAEQNVLWAMWNLGDMYQRGEDGVQQDRRLAFIWFERASEAGLPEAMERLGLAYLSGVGTVVDEEKTKEWLVKAAENGNASAECSLGTRYAEGEFGEKDFEEAVNWWRKAAENGDATAMCNLGRILSDPDSSDNVIKIDLDEARKWFHDADEAGNEAAAGFLGLDVLSALGKHYETYADWQVAFKTVNPESGAARRILRKAGSWFLKPLDAHTDDAELAGASLRWLARIARYQEDLEQAKDLYRQAAEKGDEKAKKELTELESGGVATAETNVAPEVSPAVPKAPVPAMATSVEPPKPEPISPVVVPPAVQPPVGDEVSRAEALFLRKARRLKKNDGRIDPNEKLELRELAAELGISVLRREELIEQIEEEFETGM